MLAAIVTSSSDAIVSKTLDGFITSWNEAAIRIFEYTPSEIIGKHITILIPQELQSEEDDILRCIRRGERVEHFDTMRRKKSGDLIPVSLTISPIRDSQDRIVGASKIARDITERKRHEERQRLLMNELKHRVKNMLSTVGAIARRSFRGSEYTDPLSQFLQRISALSSSYNYLFEEDRRQAKLGEVIDSVLAPFATEDDRISIKRGPGVFLSPVQATSIALAINELSTNAVKYGSLSNSEGRVEIWWERGEGGDVHFAWIEIGGPRVQLPAHSGFGTEILTRALNSDLKTKTELIFAPDGLRFKMRFIPTV